MVLLVMVDRRGVSVSLVGSFVLEVERGALVGRFLASRSAAWLCAVFRKQVVFVWVVVVLALEARQQLGDARREDEVASQGVHFRAHLVSLDSLAAAV